jgi:hypothetical protein
MSEDGLLHKLGDLARFDDRWDRLAAGTLSTEEEAELRALAETSQEAREAYEAFRPLGPDFHAAVARAIQTRAGEPGAKPSPFSRRTRRLAAWSAAAAAAAAVLAVLLRLPPLPAYSLAEISGGSRATRGEATAAGEWAPGDRFEASLRPQTEVRRGSLQARAFLVRGGELRTLRLRSQFDRRGSVKLEGLLDRDLSPGNWTLWVVVVRRGAAPDPTDLRSLPASGPVRRRGWVAVPVALRIASRAP